MHILSDLLHRLRAWLTALDCPVEPASLLRDWADLPHHHPRRD